jgi:hypothetical protein
MSTAELLFVSTVVYLLSTKIPSLCHNWFLQHFSLDLKVPNRECALCCVMIPFNVSSALACLYFLFNIHSYSY